jgi:hypothetical protein
MKYNNIIRLAIICIIIVMLPATVDYVNENVEPFLSFAVGIFIGATLFKKII